MRSSRIYAVPNVIKSVKFVGFGFQGDQGFLRSIVEKFSIEKTRITIDQGTLNRCGYLEQGFEATQNKIVFLDPLRSKCLVPMFAVRGHGRKRDFSGKLVRVPDRCASVRTDRLLYVSGRPIGMPHLQIQRSASAILLPGGYGIFEAPK